MNIIKLIPFLLLAACASAIPQQQSQSPNPNAPSLAVDYTTPPRTVEYSWQAPETKALETADTLSVNQEEQRYQASVRRIDNEISDDYFKYNPMCVDNEGSKSTHCYEVLVELCKIDELIDSRGGHHAKFFCAKDFMAQHKP